MYYLRIKIMKNYIVLLTTLILFISSNLLAQEVKFGKVSKKELEEKFYPLDTSANAVVLFKKRTTRFEHDAILGLRLVTEIHERIKLFNKDGFGFATKKIRLYMGSATKESFLIKAYTYNLSEGKIEKTKLEKNGIFKEKISENWSGKNFTMPNLKDGSIVEWKYSINSPHYTSIDDVICQYNIPIKHLEFNIKILNELKFKVIPNRYYPIKINEVNSSRFTDNVSIQEKVYSGILKNVPALVKEPYINNMNNYRAKINFEITAYIPKTGNHKYFNDSWEDVTKTIYNHSRFGNELDKKYHFIDDLKIITKDIKSNNQKLDVIFNFVKNKIKWNKRISKYVSSSGIKKAFKDGIGNSAEINLTLVSMLREAGFKSNPVLISTRSHGIPLFPTKEGYNYVIAGVEIQNQVILMDATDIYSSPNILPERVLNWEGRLIRENGTSMTIDLYPKEYNTKNVFISAQLDGEGSVSGILKTNYTSLNALKYRNNYNSLSETKMLNKLETVYEGIEIEKIRLSNKTELSKPITEMIKFTSDNQVDIIGDKIYVSPLLFLTQQENPFKLEERLYPIDYGSSWKKDIRLTIQIPQNFTVSSKPEDIALELPDNLGTYILKISVTNNQISVISQTKINEPLIGAIHYKILKELYKQAIEKQKEKIVLLKS